MRRTTSDWTEIELPVSSRWGIPGNAVLSQTLPPPASAIQLGCRRLSDSFMEPQPWKFSAARKLPPGSCRCWSSRVSRSLKSYDRLRCLWIAMHKQRKRSLWGRLKVGRLYGQRFATRRDAMDEVIDWLTFYNHRRLHSTLGYVSPMKFEERWHAVQQLKAA